MSSKVTINQSKGVRVVGIFAIVAGIILILGGGATYALTATQLRAEKITVSADADFLGGQRVQGPLTAYAQASVINKHALDGSGGLTYAQLDKDDPARESMMNASFLRASLFTSVVAFGVAILVVGLGVLFVLVGWALRRITAGPAIVVENFDAPVGRHVSGTDDEETGDTPATDDAKAADKTAPATRVPRRAALASQETGAESPSLGGAAVAETLSRHARSAPEAVAPAAVSPAPAVPFTPATATPTPAAATPTPATEDAPVSAGPADPAEQAAPVSQSPSTTPTFDEIVAEPAGETASAADDSIPVPPRQSWQSPADRAADNEDESPKSAE